MLTTTPVPGAPSWIDLESPDSAESAAFYGELFGWGYESAGSEGGGYGFFTLDGRLVAGVGPLQLGPRASWLLSFHTENIDAAVAAARGAGGGVVVEPMDVHTGRMAVVADPTGGRFGLWQPRDHGGLGVVNAPGTLNWTELYSTDATLAAAFYRAVLGWEVSRSDIGGGTGLGGVTYYVVSPAGGSGPRSAHGGIMQLPRENLAAGSRSEWHPYFAVTDCDAALNSAVKQGASVLFPPMELPDAGRLAMFADPAGAVCAVIAGSLDGAY